MKTFGEQLKELRAEKEFTQKDLAKILNVRNTTISAWEKDIAEPPYETLKKVAVLFDVSADYLLGLEDDYGSTAIPIDKNPVESLSPTERKILRQYRNLCTGYQNLIEEQIQFLTDQEEALKIPDSVIPNTPNNKIG